MPYKETHGKTRKVKKRPFIKKAAVVCAVLVLAVAGVTGGTAAWLFTQTDQVVNTFDPSHVSCEVEETFNPNTGIKENVQVKNTSDISAYIRVRLVSYQKDGEKIVAGESEIPDFEVPSTWVQIGDYYYCKAPVPAGGTTPVLIDRCELTKGQVLEVLAEAIQSEPDEAVETSWGVTVDDRTNEIQPAANGIAE